MTEGNSGNPTICDPDAPEGEECCTADPGGRYLALAQALASADHDDDDEPALAESICAAEYQGAMVGFIAATEGS